MSGHPFRFGIVGAAGRGGRFAAVLHALSATVEAVCDTDETRLEQARAALGAEHAFTDYEQMLEQAALDAVLVATPMQLHVPMATAALQRDIAVLSEVTAGVSVDECRQLVEAAERSTALYMLAENYCYSKPNTFIAALVGAGLFGEPYYAEGEYLHDVTALAEDTPWRRHWQMGVRGVTYCTHSLGPILQWFGDDRVVRVCCDDTGAHRADPRGALYASDSSTMLGKTARGRLIKIRVDLVSPRPHAMTNYQIQGTQGAYESARAPGEPGHLWLAELGPSDRWHDLDTLMDDPELGGRFLPKRWQQPPPAALQAGHGGGDYFVIEDFIRACRRDIPNPIDIHRAMDMTVPGLLSQQSVLEGGRWCDVPDSRTWVGAAARPPQLNMRWPVARLNDPPPVRVPAGYTLRQYRDADEPAYLGLLAAIDLARWDADRFAAVQDTILPGGFFVIVHDESGRLVATALAQHNPRPLHPQGGEVGWVAADPAHAGKGLGRAVTAAAISRLIAAGYECIYLLSDDFRLPALKVYLDIGLQPYLGAGGMAERWDLVRAQLASYEQSRR
jgi:predicted dehydrogenase/GNAT superfamily N-acetyltransferase